MPRVGSIIGSSDLVSSVFAPLTSPRYHVSPQLSSGVRSLAVPRVVTNFFAPHRVIHTSTEIMKVALSSIATFLWTALAVNGAGRLVVQASAAGASQ